MIWKVLNQQLVSKQCNYTCYLISIYEIIPWEELPRLPLSCFLLNNFRGAEMLFEIESQGEYFISILPRQQIGLIVFLYRRMKTSVTPFFSKTTEKAVPCCTLVILGMQMFFLLKRKRFSTFNLRCECLYYILIR